LVRHHRDRIIGERIFTRERVCIRRRVARVFFRKGVFAGERVVGLGWSRGGVRRVVREGILPGEGILRFRFLGGARGRVIGERIFARERVF